MSGAAKDPHLQPSLRQRPLMMQLGLASASLAQPKLAQGKNIGNDFWEEEEGKATKATMEKVIEGLRKYQMHTYQRPLMHNSVVWSDGEARLIWYAANTGKRKQPATAQIFIMPSMINGTEILDILPKERSLLHWLTQQGFDVFLLEWGYMRDDPDLADLDRTLGVKMARLTKWLKEEKSDIPIYGLGYCMGGVMLSATEILYPDVFDGLIYIATPWDFTAGGKDSFASSIRRWVDDGGLLRVAHLDYMPNEWLQLIFSGTDPSMVARKFSSFANMETDSKQARLFVAVEDWVNGGADLPAGIIRQAVNDWYIHNKTAEGKWRINRKIIKAEKITKPCFVVIPAKDKIVPPSSAISLAKKLCHATTITPDCGHISMMVGSKAEAEIWKPMKEWIVKSIKAKR